MIFAKRGWFGKLDLLFMQAAWRSWMSLRWDTSAPVTRREEQNERQSVRSGSYPGQHGR